MSVCAYVQKILMFQQRAAHTWTLILFSSSQLLTATRDAASSAPTVYSSSLITALQWSDHLLVGPSHAAETALTSQDIDRGLSWGPCDARTLACRVVGAGASVPSHLVNVWWDWDQRSLQVRSMPWALSWPSSILDCWGGGPPLGTCVGCTEQYYNNLIMFRWVVHVRVHTE